MRTLYWHDSPDGSCSLKTPWRYALLAEDIEAGGLQCESYGLLVHDTQSGQETAVRHITTNARQALVLLATVAQMEVSPVTLSDVVEDYLGQ